MPRPDRTPAPPRAPSPRGIFEKETRRKRLAFGADAGHYWNLNRYSTGRHKLQGSIVSIQRWSIAQNITPSVPWKQTLGRRESLDRHARVASAVRAASFSRRTRTLLFQI